MKLKLGVLSLLLVGLLCFLQMQPSLSGNPSNPTGQTPEDAYQITELHERQDYVQVDVLVTDTTSKEQLRSYTTTILDKVKPDYPKKPICLWFYTPNATMGRYDSRKPNAPL